MDHMRDHATRRDPGGGAHRSSAQRSVLRTRRGALGVAVGALLVANAAVAGAANPPLGPGNIEIFNNRDMVALEGYTEQAGQTATVKVQRGDTTIGIGEGVVDSTGFLEFNHPGGECWIGVTPDIRGGDVVEVSFSESSFTDGATVGSAVITGITASTPVATPEAGDVEGTVTITGTYGPDVDLSRFVVEVVNPEMREAGSAIGERAIGWTPGNDPAHPNGGPGHTADGTAGGGQFSATFGLQSADDQQLVLNGDHVVMTWLADGTGDLALGATQFEYEETNGPGFGGCPAGPGAQPPVGPSSATLTTTDTTITATWPLPTQPADASPITAYRVAALDEFGQEIAVRTGQRTATVQGLTTGQAYEVTIEAYNGQWSGPQSVGTATPGTVVVTPPDEPPVEEPPAGEPTVAPAAPTGLTTNATGTDAISVSWAASPAAESVTRYDVAVTSAVAGAAVPASQTVAPPATTASFSGLTPGTPYTVSVTATNTVGTSQAATADVTTPTVRAPSAPRVVRVQSGHESATVEWTAAQPADAFSPVTGYDVVATPPAGAASATTLSVTGTIARLTGLQNGVAYTLEVYARSGDVRGAVGTFATGVSSTVTPNDVVTVGQAQYRADKREWRVRGTAQDTTGNTVVVTTWAGATIGTAAVGEDGAWTIDVRNGPQPLTTDTKIKLRSTSGAVGEATFTRR